MVCPETFSEEEFDRQFQSVFKHLVTNPNLVPRKKPRAVLLGGQSGAGKTTLHDLCRANMDGDGIVINGDEYRSYHPRYVEIGAEYGIDAPAHTGAWASRMVEELVDIASRAKYNLVIEGTLRPSEVPIKTATLLRGRGYSTDLALMAVKPEISLVSCQLRYEQMRLAGTIPRAVDPEHHRVIVGAIVDNLATLESSGLFDDISLYSRSGTCLFSSAADGDAADDGTAGVDASVGDVLREILFGAWTTEEREHYDYLKERLEEAKAAEAHPAE